MRFDGGADDRGRRRVLSTGADSPVSIDSSTRGRAVDDGAVDGHVLAGPDADEVADGDLVEGHVDLASPSRRTRAVVGARPTSALMEAAVRFLALSSSQRPIRTRATTMSAVSK